MRDLEKPAQMANILSVNPLAIACLALFISISFNIAAIYAFRHRAGAYDSAFVIDDSRFSYVENDYPHLLPLHVPSVALKIEDSEGYGLSDFSAWSDWRSTDLFPNGNGFVKLGPEGVSMFHQMHCLQRIRNAIVHGDPGYHTRHCLNLLRQAILCASDITLDPINIGTDGTDGVGVVHVCRDWEKVYDFVEKNQLRYNTTAW
ncbi:hypothetical protein PILCRDRAFT_93002 [Piloderma croceum F 1598]|uniref:Uncharacterized protein n=1 Tax=Piloderma croceum (strain F 1598) TaxID=765440 RepID=A0A0C3AIC2_PILCF|nr:hypothetical protein PILCRDRAFT_93002 [Piloderma croceum F 1598]